MALTSEDYLLGIEKEIMGTDYYKILELNTKEHKRKDNLGLLNNIEEINNNIKRLEGNLKVVQKEQSRQKVYILSSILLNLILSIVLMLIMI